jgi:hypothetical protein
MEQKSKFPHRLIQNRCFIEFGYDACLKSPSRYFVVVKDTSSWVVDEKELENLIQKNEIESAALIAVTTDSHVFEFDDNYGESELKFTHS